MSGRKLSPLEQKLHQAALADPKKTLSQKECEALIPDAVARTDVLNFLLSAGLLKAMKDTKGALSFRVVMKKELDVKKDMSGEESMILSYIQSAGNEGIWTKHLKAKTELHQTVIDRCLKSLTQKQLIKAVKSVKYPTRKIYMLFHLDPSVEMTGGPWYTDNELDTEFIKLLCSACLRFIKDRSSPKQKASEDNSAHSQPLYPISAAPSYPTAQQILTFLSKSRITETELNVDHVEMLLNVLVLDGEIEKVPAFGAAMWESNVGDVQPASESEEERTIKKRKRKDREEEPRKRKRSKHSKESDTDSDSDSDVESSKRLKKRHKKQQEDDHDDSDVDRKKKKKKPAKSDEDASAEEKSKRKKKKSKKRKHMSSSENDSSSSEGSSSDSNSEDERRQRKRSKSKSKTKRSSSPAPAFDTSSMAPVVDEEYGAHVYRAVKQEKVAFGLSQTPCMRCPTFDFCSDKGPVNPKECTYYGDWLIAANIARE